MVYVYTVWICTTYKDMIIHINYIWYGIILYQNAWKCLIWGIIINQKHSMWPSASPQIGLMIIINEVIFHPFLFYFTFFSLPVFWYMNRIRCCRMSLLLVLGCMLVLWRFYILTYFFCDPNASLQWTAMVTFFYVSESLLPAWWVTWGVVLRRWLQSYTRMRIGRSQNGPNVKKPILSYQPKAKEIWPLNALEASVFDLFAPVNQCIPFCRLPAFFP